MVEAHYAVPALNAVLNTLNTRLDAALIAWQMNHCEAAVLITDREFAPTIGAGAALLREQHGRTPVVIDVCDSEYAGAGERLGAHEYEALLAAHAPLAAPRRARPTSGTRSPSLHLGHHRRPEGRRHASPRRLPERGVQRGDLDDAALPALPVDAADVPLQRLVLPVDGGDARRHARVPAQGRGARRSSTRCASDRADHYCAAPIVHNLLIAAPAELRAGIAHKVRAWSPARRRRPR